MRTYKRGTAISLLLVFVAFAVLGTLSPSSALAEQTKPSRTVRVNCNVNNSLYLDEDGKPAGYCSEYLIQLAQVNNWQLEYVPGSWSDSVQNLYDGKIDLLLPTQMTEDRIGKMGFSNAIGGYQPIAIFANVDSDICYDDFDAFDGMKIAISKGTSNEESLIAYAAQNGFTYQPVYMNTTDEKIEAMRNGTVDMVVFSTLTDVADAKLVSMLDYLPFYYCTNINDTALLNELNYGMNQMIIRNPDLVQQVFYEFMANGIPFAYTADEKKEIEEHGKIIIGIYEHTEPLFGVREDGTYQGIYVDLVERIKKISGLDIGIKALSRKELAFDYLNRGDVDFVLGSSQQSSLYSDQENYVQSEGVMDYYTLQITKGSYQEQEGQPVVAALTLGRRYWAPQLQERYPGVTIEYYETSKECLNAVTAGKADLTMLNSWEYNYQSKNQRFEDLIEWENTRTLSQAVLTSHKDENILIRSVINKSIEQISNAEKEKIITSNLNIPYHSFDFNDRLYEAKDVLTAFVSVFLIVLVGFSCYLYMRRKSMQVLKEKNQQLEESNEAKDRFLSRMSHELRTPLNAINGYATVMDESLQEHKVDKAAGHSYMESIQRAVKYQLAIIGDLLDVQKIESGKMELTPIEMDFTTYMKSIVSMIEPEAKAKGIDFTYERLSNVSETYVMDGVRFEQVLLNLLHNAVKFTPEGGKVKMTAEVVDHNEQANTLKFVIADTGIGMSEDFQQNYLFRRFAQEYKGNTSPYEGCGTGLAISREILHLMGGEITCESKQGVGSVFTVIVTAKHTDKRKRRGNRIDFTAYDLQGTNVLLCEDNPVNQDIEKRLLEKMHCNVDVAQDGKQGVERFEQSAENGYDIILMDIRMPVMDGYEATRTIRAADRADAKTIPILAVSANSFPEDIRASLDSGMNEHLAKPVDVKMLYTKISYYLKHKAK